jgi:hypothetical protein
VFPGPQAGLSGPEGKKERRFEWFSLVFSLAKRVGHIVAYRGYSTPRGDAEKAGSLHAWTKSRR